MDIDVLAARDQRRGAPAGHAKIGGHGRGEIAGVRENGDRSLPKRLAWTVATESPADAHFVPGVRHAEAVAAENVDAIHLPHSPDLAGVVHRHLLSDDEDLLEFRIHPDQLSHAVARRGRWQIDHAAVELVARLETFQHAVVDRDVTFRRLHGLPAPPGRRAEYDIAAGIAVTDRRDAA
jgi:hypothetical protein